MRERPRICWRGPRQRERTPSRFTRSWQPYTQSWGCGKRPLILMSKRCVCAAEETTGGSPWGRPMPNSANYGKLSASIAKSSLLVPTTPMLGGPSKRVENATRFSLYLTDEGLRSEERRVGKEWRGLLEQY